MLSKPTASLFAAVLVLGVLVCLFVGSLICLALLVGTLVSSTFERHTQVSGKVSYDGKTVSVGTITFFPEKGRAVSAEIVDGRYSADGVRSGAVTVTVNTATHRQTRNSLEKLRKSQGPVKDKQSKEKSPPALPGAEMMARARDETWARLKDMTDVPQKYAHPETSGLAFTIEPGEQEIDMALARVPSKKEKDVKDKGAGP